MLRRSPRIIIGSVDNIGRYSNFQGYIRRQNANSDQRREYNFHSSAPQESGYLIYSEELENSNDDANYARSIENISTRRESFNRNPEVVLDKKNYNLPETSNTEKLFRSYSDDTPEIRVINASHVRSDNIPNIPDSYEGSNLHSVAISTSRYQEGEEYTRTYKRRFWVLFVFCTLNWFSCVEWNTWGPISESVFMAFPDWNSFTVATMDNCTTSMFIVFVLPVCWLTRKIGLRYGILISSFILAVGLGLRCIANQSPLFTIMCYLCSILIGISMTLILSAPPMVASVWFPPNERTTAASVIIAVGQLGTVGSYLEPLVIRDPSNGASAQEIKSDIMMYLYIVAAIGVILFLMILIYFPSRPPHPPSYTSSTARLNFKEGLLSIMKNLNFIVFVTIYGIAVGPSLGWIGLLNFSLKPLDFDQDEAMYVGLVASLACCVVTVVTGRLTDMIYGYLKGTIVFLLLTSAVSYYWFLLLYEDVIPFSRWQVFVSVSLGLSLNYAAIPLFYELSVEILYPAHEVLIGGVVTAFDCFSTSIFLYMYSLRSIGFGWVNYVLVASNAVSCFFLLFLSLPYAREKLDVQDSDQTE